MIPDPRLVAALAEALHASDEHPQCWAEPFVGAHRRDDERIALAILPAFLSDPLTHAWLAARIRRVDGNHDLGAGALAAAILGVEP